MYTMSNKCHQINEILFQLRMETISVLTILATCCMLLLEQ